MPNWAQILGPEWRVISFSAECVQFILGDRIPTEGMIDMFRLPPESSYAMVELYESGLLIGCRITEDRKHVFAKLQSGFELDLMDPATTRAFELRSEMEKLWPGAHPIAIIQVLLDTATVYRETVNKARG